MNASIPSDTPSTGKKHLQPEAQAAAETVLYGVTGWPLAQSLSPLLHNTGFKTLGLPALYLRWEIEPMRLPAFVDSVRTLRIGGCSVTIPHKIALLPLLDKVSPLARQVGAVNTIYWQGDQLCGENTDVAGFMAPLAQEDLRGANVLLLGAGGAARAAAAGLTHLAQDRRAGAVFICTPSDSSHLPLAEEFGLTPVPWAQRHEISARLVVNTTPLGMRGKAEDETPYFFDRADTIIGKNAVQTTSLAYDIVYNPLKTLFLRDAASHGRRCLSGMDMFLGQGDAQFRLWTGQGLPLESRRALEATLASG
ncbi:MAG: shikimate dehydrogenase [Desulfovibrio sp.]|nr:shikimate dehydrogenase [Desulfovibrio sp.]